MWKNAVSERAAKELPERFLAPPCAPRLSPHYAFLRAAQTHWLTRSPSDASVPPEALPARAYTGHESIPCTTKQDLKEMFASMPYHVMLALLVYDIWMNTSVCEQLPGENHPWEDKLSEHPTRG